MNIGALAKTSGVSAKMIRHYEAIGAIPKAGRSASGYRFYSENDVHVLKFVKRARSLGFTMPEIKKLVGLWRNKKRASREVKNLTLSHLKDLEARIKELQEMAGTLRNLARHCHGDQRPDCPILEGMES